MTTTCRDFDVLLSLRAAGALDAAEAARLEAHLAGCPACRAGADDLAAALDLAKLPPVSDAERRAFDALPARTLAALRREARVRSIAKRVAAGLVAAAAAAAVVLAPALLHRRAAPPGQGPAAGWEQPDLDTIWSDASVLDLDASTDTSADATGAGQGQEDWDADAALAVVDQ
jgi:anti-sigma factor RsiW